VVALGAGLDARAVFKIETRLAFCACVSSASAGIAVELARAANTGVGVRHVLVEARCAARRAGSVGQERRSRVTLHTVARSAAVALRAAAIAGFAHSHVAPLT
jgi:hypothetical protein